MTEESELHFTIQQMDILDHYKPSEEDIPNHWNGEGTLEFRVLSYDKTSKYCPYEIEYLDYCGCVGGLDETLGIEHSINEGILDVGKLHIGWTYKIHGITVHWTHGDGWTTDDDVDYYIEGDIYKSIVLTDWITAWWWHLIGHRIRNWRKK